MDALIHDLLEYGRLGCVQLPLMPINLNQVLEQVLFRLGFEIRTSKAQIKVLGPLPEVTANAEMLEQVLTNLVENSIKFVPPGTRPRVEIRAELRSSICRLWIQDNGIGIPEPYRQRIFEVFETLPSPQVGEGTGIGLAIVKQGMQRMGGRVGLESRPSHGSRFWIELPAVSRTASKAPAQPKPSINGNGHATQHRLMRQN
jgi:signal transduction histidine kinase